MSHRTRVAGVRPVVIWLLIAILVLLVAGTVVGILYGLPWLEARQELERHYAAGIAYQEIEDWAAADAEFRDVISVDADYKDVQARLAGNMATVAAVAAAREAQAQVEMRATATAEARATADTLARADATATVVAEVTFAAHASAVTMTVEALEVRYQQAVTYMDSSLWVEAQAELQHVSAVDPAYKDVQARFAEVKTKTAEIEATATAVALVTQTAQAHATAEARVEATTMAAAAATAATEALEVHYQKGLGYISLGQWENAKFELEQVFEVDPNYKEVQAKLAEVEAEIAKLAPTHTPTISVTATDTPVPQPTVLPVDATGQPLYRAGRDLGYHIWRDPGAGWHIRWSGDRRGHDMSGSIRIVSGSSARFSSVDTYSFDRNVPDTMSHTDSHIAFDAYALDGEDGLDFAISGPCTVRFDLVIDGTYDPLRVYIGKDRRNPDAIPFSLANP